MRWPELYCWAIKSFFINKENQLSMQGARAWLKHNWSKSHILPNPAQNCGFMRVSRLDWKVPTFIGPAQQKSGVSGRAADVLQHSATFGQPSDILLTGQSLHSFPLFACLRQCGRTTSSSWFSYPTDGVQTDCWRSTAVQSAYDCSRRCAAALARH